MLTVFWDIKELIDIYKHESVQLSVAHYISKIPFIKWIIYIYIYIYIYSNSQIYDVGNIIRIYSHKYMCA